MIPKDLNQLTETDLQRLVAENVDEGPRLDFKAEPVGGDREAKKRFAADICAMANSAGGDIVYGIAEDKSGRAASLNPLSVDADAEVLRLTNLVTDLIEPKLHGVRFQDVRLESGGIVIVGRVPRSSAGIHRVKGGEFYVRESRSNKPLDVPGIVSRVAEYLGRTDRLTEFFARRYADILTNQYPISLRDGPKLVTHLVPARDFLSGDHVDVFDFRLNDIPYLESFQDIATQPCVDGRVFWNAGPGGASIATTLLHSGVVESILHVDPGSSGEVDLDYIEQSIFGLVHHARSVPKLVSSLGFPLLVRMALLGTQGMGRYSKDRVPVRSSRIRQTASTLVLPDAVIETPESSVDSALHYSMNRMWNAWGKDASPNFFREEGTGLWKRRFRN